MRGVAPARLRRRLADPRRAARLRQGAPRARPSSRSRSRRRRRKGTEVVGRRRGGESDFASFRPWLERHRRAPARATSSASTRTTSRTTCCSTTTSPASRPPRSATVFAGSSRSSCRWSPRSRSDEDDAFLRGPVPDRRTAARSRSRRSTAFGFDLDSFRLDTTVHPFAITSASSDIRLTTRYEEDDLDVALQPRCTRSATASTSAASARRSSARRSAAGCSSALHESQSRLWENVVGRSLPFWRWFYPRVQETFPDALGDVPLETFHRAVNRVRPSFIRVDADEIDLRAARHPALRARAGAPLRASSRAADLPEAWNARFEEYLGLDGAGRRARRAAGRPLVGRGRSATSRPTRSAT